jgi:hypothetical protein
MAETRSTCPYCGVGCGVVIESDGAQITGVRGDPDHPANFGRLCTKGSTLHLTASAAITRRCGAAADAARGTRPGRCSRWTGTPRSTIGRPLRRDIVDPRTAPTPWACTCPASC